MRKIIRNRQQLLGLGGVIMVFCVFTVIIAILQRDPRKEDFYQLILETAPWFFLMGALMFAVAQRGIRVASSSLTINRLYSIQTTSHILFVLAGVLMIEHFNNFLLPLVATNFDTYQIYVNAVPNNWIVLILIGSIIQAYTTLRLDSELKKKA